MDKTVKVNSMSSQTLLVKYTRWLFYNKHLNALNDGFKLKPSLFTYLFAKYTIAGIFNEIDNIYIG